MKVFKSTLVIWSCIFALTLIGASVILTVQKLSNDDCMTIEPHR